jgi:hypothetical protein
MLQTLVSELQALALDAEQALSWAMIGPGFLALQALTAERAAVAWAGADRIAECAVALAFPVACSRRSPGRSGAVAVQLPAGAESPTRRPSSR